MVLHNTRHFQCKILALNVHVYIQRYVCVCVCGYNQLYTVDFFLGSSLFDFIIVSNCFLFVYCSEAFQWKYLLKILSSFTFSVQICYDLCMPRFILSLIFFCPHRCFTHTFTWVCCFVEYQLLGCVALHFPRGNRIWSRYSI